MYILWVKSVKKVCSAFKQSEFICCRCHKLIYFVRARESFTEMKSTYINDFVERGKE